jgi:hypothetical protein
VLSFAILWFFCGHLLESTVVPLEVYFEHRNYLPLFGSMFALAYAVLVLTERFPDLQKATLAGMGLYVTLLIGTLALNTSLWGNPLQLIIGWSQEHPQSPRAVEMLASLETDMGYTIQDKRLTTLMANMQQTQTSQLSYMLFRELAQQCLDGKLDASTLERASQQAATSLYMNSTSNAFYDLVDHWTEGKCTQVSADNLSTFFDTLSHTPNLQRGDFPHYIQYGLARIWQHERSFAKAATYMQKAYTLKPELGGLLMTSSLQSSAGLYDQALASLQDTQLLAQTWRGRMMLALRQPDIDATMQQILQQKQQYGANNHDNTQHHIASQK